MLNFSLRRHTNARLQVRVRRAGGHSLAGSEDFELGSEAGSVCANIHCPRLISDLLHTAPAVQLKLRCSDSRQGGGEDED